MTADAPGSPWSSGCPAGQGVSYGHEYVTDRDTSLGLVPLGYADGIPRTAGNRRPGAGRRAGATVAGPGLHGPVRRRPRPGRRRRGPATRSCCFGAGADGEPTAQDWAEAAGTISYEIVTRIGPAACRASYVGAEAAPEPQTWRNRRHRRRARPLGVAAGVAARRRGRPARHAPVDDARRLRRPSCSTSCPTGAPSLADDGVAAARRGRRARRRRSRDAGATARARRRRPSCSPTASPQPCTCWLYQRRALRGRATGSSSGTSAATAGPGRRRPTSYTIDQLGARPARRDRRVAPSGPLVLVGHSMGGMTIWRWPSSTPTCPRAGARRRLVATSAGGAELTDGRPRRHGRPGRRARLGPGVLARLSRHAGPARARSASSAATSRTSLVEQHWPSPRRCRADARALRRRHDLLDTRSTSSAASCRLRRARHSGRPRAARRHRDAGLQRRARTSLTPPVHSEEIVRRIPGAEHVVVEDAGHMSCSSTPSCVNPAAAHAHRRGPSGPWPRASPVSSKPRVRRAVSRRRQEAPTPVARRAAGRPGRPRGRRRERPRGVVLPRPSTTRRRSGARLGRLLRAGDLVVLTGDLGAGKTTLTQGIGEGLGVRGAVTSPTFVIARVHPSLVGGPGARARRRLPARRRRRARRPRPRRRRSTTASPSSSGAHGLAEDLGEDRLEVVLDVDTATTRSRTATVTGVGGRLGGGARAMPGAGRPGADSLTACCCSRSTPRRPRSRSALHDGAELRRRGDRRSTPARTASCSRRCVARRARRGRGHAGRPHRHRGRASGPGPFTGLRVGLVTARTIGLALGIPVHGVCSLDALAAEAWRGAVDVGELLVATDARRKEVYWARYAAVADGAVGADRARGRPAGRACRRRAARCRRPVAGRCSTPTCSRTRRWAEPARRRPRRWLAAAWRPRRLAAGPADCRSSRSTCAAPTPLHHRRARRSALVSVATARGAARRCAWTDLPALAALEQRALRRRRLDRADVVGRARRPPAARLRRRRPTPTARRSATPGSTSRRRGRRRHDRRRRRRAPRAAGSAGCCSTSWSPSARRAAASARACSRCAPTTSAARGLYERSGFERDRDAPPLLPARRRRRARHA